jgi:Family of unknown function (DUF6516)
MDAKLLLNERRILTEVAFVELVVWQVPVPLSGSHHRFKYRLAFVVNGACVLRHDNEAGKGDHRHVGPEQIPYMFTNPEKLLDDFWHDVDTWRY